MADALIQEIDCSKDELETYVPIDVIPKEILLVVFLKLSHADKMRARRVCKSWFMLLKDMSLWKQVSLKNEKRPDSIPPLPRVFHSVARYATEMQELNCSAVSYTFASPSSADPYALNLFCRGLEHLQNLKSIHMPPLKEKHIALRIFQTIAQCCRELDTFHASLYFQVDETCAQVFEGTRIKHLHITYPRFLPEDCTEQFVRQIPQCFPSLQTMEIEQLLLMNYPLGFTDDSLKQLGESKLELHSLHLDYSEPTTPAGVRHLVNITSLKSLRMRFRPQVMIPFVRTSIQAKEDTEVLEIISQGLQDLTTFELHNFEGMTDNGLLMLAHNLKKLRHLHLVSVDLSNRSLDEMGQHLTQLEDFSFTGPTKIMPTEAGYFAFVDKLKRTLKTVQLVSVGVSEKFSSDLTALFPNLKIAVEA